MEQEAIIESILFVFSEAVPVSKLAEALELDVKTARNLTLSLQSKYDDEKRGLKIIEVNNAFALCARETNFDYIKKIFRTNKSTPLTSTLIETLAIIAYKQPITKPAIEAVRGANADHAVSKLMERGLVCEKGRLDAPGKPILFGTTDDFLKHFGFTNLSKLPNIDDVSDAYDK